MQTLLQAIDPIQVSSPRLIQLLKPLGNPLFKRCQLPLDRPIQLAFLLLQSQLLRSTKYDFQLLRDLGSKVADKLARRLADRTADR